MRGPIISVVRPALLFILVAGFYAGTLFFLAEKTGIHTGIIPATIRPGSFGDIEFYFQSASWLQGGTLYRDAPSDYPLVANVIFAAIRFVSSLFNPGFYAFAAVWMAASLLVYLAILETTLAQSGKLAALAWLTPAAIYYTVICYDIYPAAVTLLALLAMRRMAYLEGAAWLGLAIALKGYPVILLPAYCIFVLYRRDFIVAVKAGVLAVAPIIVGLLITFAFAGWDGLNPFAFHLTRPLNGESTYDEINLLFGSPVVASGMTTIQLAHGLQIGCALLAAAMRPKTFDELVSAFLFALLGFMSFSVFYSPQYLLWVLPIACLASSRGIIVAAIVFSWLTYLHFHLVSALLFFQLTPEQLNALHFVALGILRLFMMVLAGIQFAFLRRHGSGWINRITSPKMKQNRETNQRSATAIAAGSATCSLPALASPTVCRQAAELQ